MTTSWLVDHLIRAGHLTESGLTRRARLRRCWSCGLFTMVGLDDDTCAMEAHADPVPLSPIGEALALVEGRRTWSLRHQAGRFILDQRDSFQIAGKPAGTRLRWDVLREHRCQTEPLVPPLAAPSSFPSATADRLPPGSPAPF